MSLRGGLWGKRKTTWHIRCEAVSCFLDQKDQGAELLGRDSPLPLRKTQSSFASHDLLLFGLVKRSCVP
jgi:hypothetical protein